MITINARKIFDFEPSITVDEFIAAQALVVSLFEERIMAPGKIENFVFMCDMKNCGTLEIKYPLMLGIVNYISKVLKGRSRIFIVLNAPRSFSAIWKVVKRFIDETSTLKLAVVSDS